MEPVTRIMTSTLLNHDQKTTAVGRLPRIQSVELHPVTTGRLYGEPSQHVLLKLTAEDGSIGWGEMSDVSHLPAMMPDVADLERCLNLLLSGQSAGNVLAIEQSMLDNFPGTRFHGKACLVRQAVSIAAYDLKARILGLSLSDLLGGARRSRIAICYPIFRMKTKDDVADRKHLVATQFDKGFTAFRLYFSLDTSLDEELLDWIALTYGSRITLTSLDGSGLFSLPAFLRAYHRLSKFSFESIESPVDRDDVDLISEARRRIQHPVSEHVRSAEYAIRLIRAHAVDIFNISITVAGGIGGMLQLFNVAQAANIECLIGTTQELSVATAAQAHVGAVVTRLDYASDPVGPELYHLDVTHRRARFEDGCLLVPEGIGHGIDVDPELLASMNAPLSSVNEVRTNFTRG
jgi:L-alanine-DL-glutamate epimerase-like enolase superfamily enzyme